jgi:GR25 family glycosyltransferase involved in LPS biosynthesis
VAACFILGVASVVPQDCDSAPACDGGRSRGAGGDCHEWEEAADRWMDWWKPVLHTAFTSMVAGPGTPAVGAPATLPDLPVFVMNLAHRSDRRASMQKHLRDIGLTRVVFPPTKYAKNVSADDRRAWETLLDKSCTLRADKEEHTPYITNALDHIKTLQAAVAAGHDRFAIFEDDLVPAAGLEETRKRVRQALDELPPDADMLYLEYCNENCSGVRYSRRRPHLLRSHSPCASAAIVFTRKGALKILANCRPIWASIDGMYRALIMSGELIAFSSHPVAFFQDRRFLSDAAAGRNGGQELYRAWVERVRRQPALSLPSVSPICTGLEEFVEIEALSFIALGCCVRSIENGLAYNGLVESVLPPDPGDSSWKHSVSIDPWRVFIRYEDGA